MNEKKERQDSVGAGEGLGGCCPPSFGDAERLIHDLLCRVFETAPRLPGKRWSSELSAIRAEAGQKMAAHAALHSAALQGRAGSAE